MSEPGALVLAAVLVIPGLGAGLLALLYDWESPFLLRPDEAFVRILGRFGDLRRPEVFRTYLMRTVTNLARSGFRHRGLSAAEGGNFRGTQRAVKQHQGADGTGVGLTVLVGDYIFMTDDGGIGQCLEAKTGKQVWRERIGGNQSASPIAASTGASSSSRA